MIHEYATAEEYDVERLERRPLNMITAPGPCTIKTDSHTLFCSSAEQTPAAKYSVSSPPEATSIYEAVCSFYERALENGVGPE
mmetsp:Transcript_1707/g.6014  ORF Transcript_1707/g.6014 Transcript_1707/m.6014 type:complete len:83 (+) Transcript_1707:2634-2882(+)